MGYRFVHTGSTLLDGVLGGGWALGRMAHVVGDSSTGKTQLAIEAAANFARAYPDGIIRYLDAEYAFDDDYASRVGFPEIETDPKIKYPKVQMLEASDLEVGITLEDFELHINKLIKDLDLLKSKNSPIGPLPPGTPGCFILDSLDAVPTLKEATNAIEDISGYGTQKSKDLGKIFRTTMSGLARNHILFICISQTRINISVKFGDKRIFSGGNAPKFYASQTLMLTRTETLSKTIGPDKIPYGVKVKAKCTKNKCGTPFRECEYDILFDHGIDDLTSCLEWLHGHKRFDLLPDEMVRKKDGNLLANVGDVKNRVYKASTEDQRALIRLTQLAVQELQLSINSGLKDDLPPSKY